MISELADLVVTYGLPALAGAALIFGTAPMLVLRVAVLLYPPNHPRRRELVAEIFEVPYKERILWIASQIVTIAFEGISARIKHLARSRGDAKENGDESEDSVRSLKSRLGEDGIPLIAILRHPQPVPDGGRDFREILFTEQLDWDPLDRD
ncbi:hypothetical protein ACWEVP_35785 [Amycolatopsis sp. NPDC003865]